MTAAITPPHSRLAALYEVSRALNASLELDPALTIVIDAAIRLTGAERGFLMLREAGAVEFRFRIARNARQEPLPESAFEVSQSVVSLVAGSGEPVVTLNARADPRFDSRSSVLNYQLRSIMAVPLRGRGALQGVLYVDSKTRDVEFTPADLDLLVSFADQAAAAILNAQLFEAERREALVRQVLLEVMQAANAAGELGEFVEALAGHLPGWLGCDRCAVAGLDPVRAQWLGLAFSHPAEAQAFGRLYQAALTGPLWDEVRTATRPVQVPAARLAEALPAGWPTAMRLSSDLLFLPLRAEAGLVGLVVLDNSLTNQPFTPLTLAAAEPLAAQLGSAFRRLQLAETARRQLHELTVLNAVATAVAEVVPLDELTGRLLAIVQPVLGMARMGVWLRDAAGALQRYPHEAPDQPRFTVPPGQGIVGAVVAAGRPERVADVTRDPRYLGRWPDTRAELCVPLLAGAQVIGVINVESPVVAAFSATDERLLMTVAGQLATAIERYRLLETERQQRAMAEVLRDVGLELTLDARLDVVLERLLGHIARVVPYDAACFITVEDEVARVAGVRGYDQFGPGISAAVSQVRLRIADTANLRRMAESGRPHWAPDVLTEPGWVMTPAAAQLRSWLGAPVMVRNQAVAFVSLDKIEPGFYQPAHAEQLAAFTSYAALALQNVHLLETTERRAAELDAVRTVSLSLTSSLDVREVLQAVLRGALSLMPGAQSASIFFYQAGRLEFGAALGADGRPTTLPPPRPHGLTRTVAETGELIVISNLQEHLLFAEAPASWQGALVGLPLRIGRQVVGVMNVAYAAPRVIAEADLRMLRLLGEQAAAAMDNARLFDAARRQVAELTLLHAVALASAENAAVDAMLERVTRLAGRYLEARYFGVWLLDKTGLLLQPHASFQGAPTAGVVLGEGALGRVIYTGRSSRINEAATAPELRPPHPETQSLVAAPLKVGGAVIGVVAAEHDRPGSYTKADEHLLVTVASQLATAIERAQLFEAERAARQQAEILREVAGQLNLTLEREPLLLQVLDQLGRLVPYQEASIMLSEPETGALRLAAGRDLPRMSGAAPAAFERFEHLQTVLDDQAPLLIADTQSDPRWQTLAGFDQIRCWLGVPLVVKGRALGVLNLGSDQPGFYTARDAEVALALANQAAAALERLQLWEATQQRERELAILLDVTRAVASSLELDDVLRQVTQAAAQTLQVQVCAISEYAPATRRVSTLNWHAQLSFQGDLPQGVFALEHYPLTARVIDQDEIALVRVDDLHTAPSETALLRQMGCHWLLMLTVHASGKPVGLMELFSIDPERQFTQADLRLARAIADQTGVALENARLFRAEREQRQLAEALSRAAVSLTASLDFDAVLDRLLDQIGAVVPYDAAALVLVDALAERAWMARWRGLEGYGPEVQAAAAGLEFEISRTANLRWMLETGQANFIADVKDDPAWVQVEGLEQFRSWAGAPVIASGTVLAFVSLRKVEPGFYQASHVARLAAFASQVGLALQNARLFEAERRRVAALTTLHDVTLDLGTRRAEPELLDAILAGALRLLEATAGAFYRLEGEPPQLRPMVQRNLPPALAGRRLALGESLAGRVAQTGETLVASGGALPLPTFDVRSALGVPLHWQQQLWGVLLLLDLRAGRFGEAEVEVMRLFADRAAIAYENVRLVDALGREKQRLELLLNLSQNLAATLDPEEAGQRALDLMRAATGADRATLFLLEPDTGRLRLRAVSGMGGLRAAELGLTLALDQGVAGHAARLRRLVAVPDVNQEPHWEYFARIDEQSQSTVAVPLLAGDALIGVLSLLGNAPHFYRDEHLPLLSAAAVSVALALQNSGLFAAEARRVHYLTVLNAITRAAAAPEDTSELLRALADRLGELTGADACYLILADQAGARFTPVAAYGLPPGVSLSRIAPALAALTETSLHSGALRVFSEQHLPPPLGNLQVGLPLVAGDQRLGAAVIVYQTLRALPRDELQRYEQAAGQIALALARVRLFAETRRTAAELAVASDLLRQLSMTSDILSHFSALAEGLRRLTGCQQVLLGWFTADRRKLELIGPAGSGQAAEERPYLPVEGLWLAPDGLAGPQQIHTVSARAGLPLDRALALLGVQVRAILPVRVGPRVGGLLALLWTEPPAGPAVNLPLLRQIVDALALAIEKDRLLGETLRHAAELETITAVSTALRAVNASAEVLEILVDHSLGVFQAGAGAILMPVEDQTEFFYAFQRHYPPALTASPVSGAGSITGQVFRTGRPYLSLNLLADTAAEPQVMDLVRPHDRRPQAALYAPLRAGPEIIGVMTLVAPAPRVFTEADLNLFSTLAEIGGNALQRARVLETLEQRVAERTRALARANEQLQELDRLKDQFVSNVSHELRTPLTAIKLHLGLLEKRGAEVLPRYLPVLQRETERLRRLIEDLLDLSRLRAQSQTVTRTPQRLDALLAHILALHHTRAEERGVSWQHQVNEAVPPVSVDQAQITQVFTNLIANAVAYTPRGGRMLVSSQLETAGGLPGVAVRVHNDGPPIPPEDLPHLFTRFYRGQTARESGEPGTGLGLAICKEIIEQHAGFIDVVSLAGAGTTFTVWLPLAVEELPPG